MSEERLKEAATTYVAAATRLVIPPEWDWLGGLDAEDQGTFFQEIIDAIAAAQQSNDWTILTERIAVWKKRAESEEQPSLAQLKQQVIKEGGSPELAALVGKYRGRLSSVDEFIRNKQNEKSLEQ
jgi:hypothetical protein